MKMNDATFVDQDFAAQAVEQLAFEVQSNDFPAVGALVTEWRKGPAFAADDAIDAIDVVCAHGS